MFGHEQPGGSRAVWGMEFKKAPHPLGGRTAPVQCGDLGLAKHLIDRGTGRLPCSVGIGVQQSTSSIGGPTGIDSNLRSLMMVWSAAAVWSLRHPPLT